MKLFVRGILFLFLVNYWYEMQGIAQVNEIMHGADLYIYMAGNAGHCPIQRTLLISFFRISNSN